MKMGGSGGANTQTGRLFEHKTDITVGLKDAGYSCDIEYSSPKADSRWIKVSDKAGNQVANIYSQEALYTHFQPDGLEWEGVISAKLKPDYAVHILATDTVYIIECKFQNVAGSVDEKIQTCDFKKKQYEKLFAPKGLKLEYIYVLSKEHFDKDKFKDVFAYIRSVGSSYYFDELPIKKLGL